MITKKEMLEELNKMCAGEEMRIGCFEGEGGYTITKGDMHLDRTPGYNHNNGLEGQFFIEGVGCSVSTEDWLESAEEAVSWLGDTLQDCSW